MGVRMVVRKMQLLVAGAVDGSFDVVEALIVCGCGWYVCCRGLLVRILVVRDVVIPGKKKGR